MEESKILSQGERETRGRCWKDFAIIVVEEETY